MQIEVSPVARRNALAQDNLIEQLEAARITSGRSMDEVAQLLGIERKMAQEALTGVRDLTLTELRMLAFAVDAVIEYEVEPASQRST